MIKVGEILLDDKITEIQFECDLSQCKGACCTMPGTFGAPLEDSEIQIMHELLPIIMKYLPDDHLEEIAKRGSYQGEPGRHSTRCVTDKACVFVAYENAIAKCAFDKAYFSGETTWHKPISCHLFPLRYDRAIVPSMRFESISACHSALNKGEENETQLVDFLENALVRAFGEAWYREFRAHCHVEHIKQLNC